MFRPGRTSAALGTAVIAMLIAGLFAAAAVALNTHIKVSVSPRNPNVFQNIRVTFTTDRTLKHGYHWQAVVIAGTCSKHAQIGVAKSHRKNVPAGTRLTIVVRSSLSPVKPDQWCPGSAFASVQSARKGGKGGKTYGTKNFTIHK